jgi:hypothetical protein
MPTFVIQATIYPSLRKRDKWEEITSKEIILVIEMSINQATPQAIEYRSDNQEQAQKQPEATNPFEKCATLFYGQYRQHKTADDEYSQIQQTHNQKIAAVQSTAFSWKISP